MQISIIKTRKIRDLFTVVNVIDVVTKVIKNIIFNSIKLLKPISDKI